MYFATFDSDEGDRTDAVRLYRLTILDEIAKTGRLLSEAKRDIPESFDMLIQLIGLSPRTAAEHMRVYQYLDQIKLAEEWGHQRGLETPTSARRALSLLRLWEKMHNN